MQKIRRRMSKYELEQIVDGHELWLNSAKTMGKQAKFVGYDLRDFDHRDRPLAYSIFKKTCLRSSDFNDSVLEYSKFRSCDLREADY